MNRYLVKVVTSSECWVLVSSSIQAAVDLPIGTFILVVAIVKIVEAGTD